MSGIRGKNTKPEIVIRKALFAKGFRYKLHDKKLPGQPDLVFPKYRAVIFVHGCFWHMHGCHLFKWPSTRQAFWREKITGNSERDKKNIITLQETGWRVLIVWECAVKGPARMDVEELSLHIASWLQGSRVSGELSGNPGVCRT